MKTLIDLLATVSIAYISYRYGYFKGIYDYVKMVEDWAKEQGEEE